MRFRFLWMLAYSPGLIALVFLTFFLFLIRHCLGSPVLLQPLGLLLVDYRVEPVLQD